MVVSELAAATMIAVCGLKNSYRIILKGERLIRRKIRRPSTIVQGYDSFPRFFIRRVFRAGLVIAMRWEGRAKNAAQLAADARLRARSAQKAVATRVEQARHRAEDEATRLRSTAESARTRAHKSAERLREKAASARQKAEEVREAAGKARDAAVKAKDAAVKAKERVVQIGHSVRKKIGTKGESDGGGKGDGGQAISRKREGGSAGGKRMMHSRGLACLKGPVRLAMVRTRFS